MSIDVVGVVPCVSVGYLLTVLFETPVLFIGMGTRHSWKKKLLAGFLLTGFSYPFVCFVFPRLFPPFAAGSIYLWIAESFAPLSECLLFWIAFDKCRRDKSVWRDMVTIVAANLTSFGLGEVLKHMHLINFVCSL